MFDAERQIVSIPAVYNLPDYFIDSRFKLNADILSQVIRSRQEQRIGDYQMALHQIKEFADAGIRAIAVVPLVARGKTLGVVWASMLSSERVFSDYDMVLLESVGAQAAVSIDGIYLFEEQRYISEMLQRGFLPGRLPKLIQTDIGVFYASATEAAVVGGDFYDAKQVPDHLISLFVGDVSGKGVAATADAAMVKYTLRAISFENPDPSHVLTRANEIVIQQLTSGHFVTVVFGSYDPETGRLTLSIAGHPHPLLYSASDRSTAPIIKEDPAFGLISHYEYSNTEISLSAGDILALYTDGIIELRRDKEFFGEARLGELIARYSGLGAQEIADRIISDAKEFASNRLTDDIVLFIIKRTG